MFTVYVDQGSPVVIPPHVHDFHVIHAQFNPSTEFIDVQIIGQPLISITPPPDFGQSRRSVDLLYTLMEQSLAVVWRIREPSTANIADGYIPLATSFTSTTTSSTSNTVLTGMEPVSTDVRNEEEKEEVWPNSWNKKYFVDFIMSDDKYTTRPKVDGSLIGKARACLRELTGEVLSNEELVTTAFRYFIENHKHNESIKTYVDD